VRFFSIFVHSFIKYYYGLLTLLTATGQRRESELGVGIHRRPRPR
jgi:hypothetical protein